MVYYFTNREIAEKLEINLARWKRWSRSFLPPDPLGGMQSGYARQYLFKDLIKVYFGGYLLSHLKLSAAESLRVLNDLSPWFKKRGYFDGNGTTSQPAKDAGLTDEYRIYFCPLPAIHRKNGPAFGYVIHRLQNRQCDETLQGRRVVETYMESGINWDAPDGANLLAEPEVRFINPGALIRTVVDKLQRTRP